MSKLFGEDSDSDAEVTITTNKEYAKSFNQLRQKEMLQKFKDKRLSDLDSDNLSSSSSEDDDEPVNPEFTKTFLKTLSSLKSHDPKIYDKSTKFFDDKPLFPEIQKKSKKTGMDLKTYERNVLLETNGKMEDSDDDGRPQSPTIREEEEQIKNEFKKILNDDSDHEAENWGNMFQKREKSKQELENEEMQYIKWLGGQKTDIGEDAKDLNPLKEFWAKPNLSKDEAFLRDYILNNGYVEDDDTELNNVRDDAKLSDDEQEVERMEEFEHKYNFRFEEPDQEFIKRYPRTVEHSVRKQDDKRAQKRVETKERKGKEKELKLKELQEIKKIKQQEIEEKIKKLKEVTGNDKLAFDDVDFEEDFDPEEHDRKMQQIFDEEYYQVEEAGEKPECPNIEELAVENWDNYDPTKDEEFDYDYNVPHCEDDDFNMDADYEPSAEERKRDLEDELIENTKDKRRRRKRRNKFMEMIKKEKPAFDPEDEKTYGEYIDEYYKLDYEDIIGDQPCRFRYVETVPNDFGLSVQEIFLATNKELNTWASLRKAIQHRPDYLERQDVRMYQQRAANLELKKKYFKSIYGEEEEKDESDNEPTTSNQQNEPKKKKKRNRKRKGSENPSTSSDASNNAKKIKGNTVTRKPVKINTEKVNTELKSPIQILASEKIAIKETSLLPYKPDKQTVALEETVVKQASSTSKKSHFSKLFRKSKNQKGKVDVKIISDNRLRAFGINPSKFHYQQKLAKKQQPSNSKQKKVTKLQKSTPA